MLIQPFGGFVKRIEFYAFQRSIVHPLPCTTFCPTFGDFLAGIDTLATFLETEILDTFKFLLVYRIASCIQDGVEHGFVSVISRTPPFYFPVGIACIKSPCIETNLVFGEFGQGYSHAGTVGTGETLRTNKRTIIYFLKTIHDVGDVGTMALLHHIIVKIVKVHFLLGFATYTGISILFGSRNLRVPQN